MSSSHVGQVLPTSAFSYTVSLRVRHPSKDLGVLSDKLRLEPTFTWKAGDPRRSQSGSPLGGTHHDSYWSALLPVPSVGTNTLLLEQFISQQLVHLARHREFFAKLQSDGGQVSLLVELAPTANASLTLSSAIARRLADLNIEVEFQFVED